MSGVCLAAMIPAMRAAARTPPFGRVPAAIRSRTCSGMTTWARATARRRVAGFSPTSIMRISPMRPGSLRGRGAEGAWPRPGAMPGLLAHERLKRADVGAGAAAVGIATGVAAAEADAHDPPGGRQRRHLGVEPRAAPAVRRGEVDARGVGGVEHV